MPLAQSTTTYIRNRELTGQEQALSQKRIRMIYDLKHLYIHEWAYDHPTVYTIFIYLRDTVCSRAESLNLLCTCWEMFKNCADQSIIWLATSYGNKANDYTLLEMTDDVKMESL